MGFDNAHLRRLAPCILPLCYILSSSHIVLSINPRPTFKGGFIRSNFFNPNLYSTPIIPFTEIPFSQHTCGSSLIYSSFKDSFFNGIPNPKGGNSIFSKFWINIKSYFNKKFPSVNTHKPVNKPRQVDKHDPQLKKTLINPTSFYDFFDNPRNTGADYKIKSDFDRTISQECPYMELVRAGPSGIIKNFLKVAPPIVKDAVSLTVSTLIGSFYRYSAETTIITTTDRLAALILNLQLTGYIYCNAEQRYRLSNVYTADESLPIAKPSLGEQMGTMPVGDELLTYVKRLPRTYINSLFESMSPEILEAMRLSTEKTIQLLTESVLGQSYLDHKLIIQQTGSFAMQLCFWKLALGYCLRDQETKIELSRSLNSQ